MGVLLEGMGFGAILSIWGHPFSFLTECDILDLIYQSSRPALYFLVFPLPGRFMCKQEQTWKTYNAKHFLRRSLYPAPS